MCRQAKEGNITVASQRDESQRTTEIVIVNHNDRGEAIMGTRVICYDGGVILGGVELFDGVDISGHAEMRGY